MREEGGRRESEGGRERGKRVSEACEGGREGARVGSE